MSRMVLLLIKSECLDKVVPLGERDLQYVIREYVEPYHRERHHHGLGSEVVAPDKTTPVDGQLRRRLRRGGVLNSTCREAA